MHFLPGVQSNWINWDKDSKKYRAVLTASESELFFLTPTVSVRSIMLNPFTSFPKKICSLCTWQWLILSCTVDGFRPPFSLGSCDGLKLALFWILTWCMQSPSLVFFTVVGAAWWVFLLTSGMLHVWSKMSRRCGCLCNHIYRSPNVNSYMA